MMKIYLSSAGLPVCYPYVYPPTHPYIHLPVRLSIPPASQPSIHHQFLVDKSKSRFLQISA